MRQAAESFRPLPLLGNPHLQTLLGAFVNGRPIRHPTVERIVPLADGDRLVLHDSIPDGWQSGGRIAILVHGLGGSHRSGYMQRVAARVLGGGVRAVRIDLRGAGRGAGLARRPYHGGCSGDLRAAVRLLYGESPGSAVAVLGFSLGGNIALKLAGEAVDEPLPGLERVAALAPPVDLARCVAMLTEPRNRLYEWYFVNSLIQEVRRRERIFRDESPVAFPRRIRMRGFDDLYTAPRWGFADAGDYYRRAAALPLLPRIRVPCLILAARDDPFIAIDAFERLRLPPHIRIEICQRGGHLGFLGRTGGCGVRWAEERLTSWLLDPLPSAVAPAAVG